MFPFMILMSFMFVAIFSAKEIVHEKETGLKEAIKLMGMSPWVYWLSWYIKMQFLLVPSLIVMVVSFTIELPLKDSNTTAAILNKSEPILFALFLFLYASGMSTFTMVCSTLFKKSNNAATGNHFFRYLHALHRVFDSF